MAYSDTSIYIHLIHNDKKALSDDTVKIVKNYETGDFDITFTDQNDGSCPVVHKAHGLYRARVVDYLYMLFKNQALDEEGYKSIQLTPPAMPRIIVAGEKMKDLYYREHFLELLGTSLDLLENVSNVQKKASYIAPVYDGADDDVAYSNYTTPRGPRPQHLFFD
jgi:hypothetical protein